MDIHILCCGNTICNETWNVSALSDCFSRLYYVIGGNAVFDGFHQRVPLKKTVFICFPLILHTISPMTLKIRFMCCGFMWFLSSLPTPPGRKSGLPKTVQSTFCFWRSKRPWRGNLTLSSRFSTPFIPFFFHLLLCFAVGQSPRPSAILTSTYLTLLLDSWQRVLVTAKNILFSCFGSAPVFLPINISAKRNSDLLRFS